MPSTDLVVWDTDTVRCSSQVVAEKFKRRHRYVVEVIEKLLEKLDKIKGPINWRLKFVEKTESYREQKFKTYWMDKEAFSLVAMRFTGDEALEWQVKFNEAFHFLLDERSTQLSSEKEGWLKQRQQGKLLRRQETDAIKLLVDYATEQGSKHAHFYYKNITSMTYRCLGFVKQAGSKSLRDTLDVVQHIQLASAEIVAARAILKGIQDKRHYKEIYLLAEQSVMANIRSFMPEFDQQPKQLTERK